ncbi:MAG: hypothetical protein IIY55_04590, partial [Blautia sp.]|nr:hypothetical protein [Blautia sp.]
FQMKILRDFMEAFCLPSFHPCQERLLRQSAEEDVLDLHEQAACSEEEQQMLVYFAGVSEENIDVKGLFDGKICGAWFNPADGTVEKTEQPLLPENGVLSLKNPAEDHKDRLLILCADPEKCTVPSGVYAEEGPAEELRKVFEW